MRLDGDRTIVYYTEYWALCITGLANNGEEEDRDACTHASM